MKRILFLILLVPLFISACGISEEEIDSKIKTGIAEELTALTRGTPNPEDTSKIPDVIGMTREEAYDAIEKLGLAPKTFWVMHDEYEYGVVADVEPGEGEIVQVGSEVVLDVVGKVIINDDDGGGETSGCGPEPVKIAGSTYQTWCACMGMGGQYEVGWPYPDIGGKMGANCTLP